MPIPPSAEYVFIRLYYESLDLTPVPLLVLRVYFGKLTNLLASGDLSLGRGKGEASHEDLLSGLTGGAEKLPVSRSHQEKAKRQMMLSRVSSIINDEAKAGTVLMEMFEMQRQKRKVQLRGRDYMEENVEKAGIWPEIMLQNLSMRSYGKELDMQMAWQRKYLKEEDYIKKREEYQLRWDVYRKNMANLIAFKRQLICTFTRQHFFKALIQAKDISFIAAKMLE